MMKKKSLLWLFCLLFISCQPKKQEIVVLPEENVLTDASAIGKEKLSDYEFFMAPIKDLSPSQGVIPYTVNAALFSDYAFKKRFVKIPAGMKAVYSHDEVMEFPQGTVLIKNFYYPSDFRAPEDNIRILETRLLISEADGWKTLPYVWNEGQTEAFLTVGGKNIDVSWVDHGGTTRHVNYSVPNLNQCRGCHLKGDKVMPIGPSARQLNRMFNYYNGDQNQLVHWEESGVLEGAPSANTFPLLADYENKDETIERRARAWLEVNCAHCHRSDGPAKNSGLHLLASVTDFAKLGVGKAPVAAGNGSGGLLYGIVPGKPEESILQFRIESTHPGIMMPEVGRKMVHAEGVELVRQWIREMTLVK